MTKFFIAGLCAVAAAVATAEVRGGAVGQPVPACDLNPLGGFSQVDLRQFHGKVLYVDFWASWCAPCKKAFPFLNDMDRQFRDRGLQILGINVDENAQDAREFLARHPASFSLAADASGSCPRAFGVTAMPSSYLVDREGIVRYVHLGFRPGEAAQLRRAVEELLSEQGDRQ